jgi:glutamate formiminotransferase/formiminotetrahydrofolate cyclodeaminase
MEQIVECVPNISEGRDQAVLDAVKAAVEAVDGVRLLDVDSGRATNRTVFTFVGAPEAVQEAAFQLVRTTQALVDMREHQGEHARQGATDVCPFVPVRGCSLEECANWARETGRRIGEELGIPVYLYGAAALSEERQSLPYLRAGEYEGLRAKLEGGELEPDFGPSEWSDVVARAGATVVGARPFLIAYNVNLNTRDKKKANDIALSVRERGRVQREFYPDGPILRVTDGTARRVPGILGAVAGVGWYIEEYGAAQVSMNLTDYATTGLHTAFDTVREEARKRGLRVTGSELVGMVPLEALLEAGAHFLQQAGRTRGVSEEEVVHTAIRSLGLSELAPFVPEERIVEYAIRDREGSLVEMTCREFADELSGDSPAPGGGSVAALSGALGSALTSMVAALTHGRREYEASWLQIEAVGMRAQALKEFFLEAVDRDTHAFNAVMDAFRIRARSDQEKASKAEAVQLAMRGAIEVPLAVLERCVEAIDLAATAVEHGNPSARSDAGVAAAMFRAGAQGAAMNVLINLAEITDTDFVAGTTATTRQLLNEVEKSADRIVADVLAELVEG